MEKALSLAKLTVGNEGESSGGRTKGPGGECLGGKIKLSIER